MSVIQQVYLPKAQYSIYIKGISPDEDNPESGEIILNGNPTRLERHERYHVDKEHNMLVTDNYDIPMDCIFNFLAANDCFQEIEGQKYIVFKKVEFKSNY